MLMERLDDQELSWQESVLITRAWVAIELGVLPSSVKARLADDPQRVPYVRVS